MGRLWIRADGSATLGFGHLMRTVALAQEAVHVGHHPHFLVAADPVAPRLPSRWGFHVSTLGSQGDRNWLDQVSIGDAVIFDGYHFSYEDHAAARRRGAVVAAIDDLGHGVFDVHILLNPNIVEDHTYELPSDTRLLIGPSYSLIRSEFRRLRRLRTGGARNLLITLGGSDVANFATALLDRMEELDSPFARATIVVGPGARSVTSRDHVEVVRDPPDLPAVFDAGDAAISAAGTTTWELLCMGVPTALVQVATNQAHVGRPLAERRVALFPGTPADLLATLPETIHDLSMPGTQERLSRAGMSMVDGHGAERLLAQIEDVLVTR